MSHPPILGTAAGRWPDEAACARSAQALAQALALAPGLSDAVITLQGGLGAGKTTFTRHLLQALGVQGRIKSPTYSVMEPHEGQVAGHPLAISHFDFYRLRDPQEWEDAGFRDVFAEPGLKLCEWPEQVAGLLPPADLALHLSIEADGSRRVQAQAHGPRGSTLLERLASTWRPA